MNVQLLDACDQPVHCTSAIRSHLLLNRWKIETLAMSGISMSDVTPPLYSDAFALTCC